MKKNLNLEVKDGNQKVSDKSKTIKKSAAGGFKDKKKLEKVANQNAPTLPKKAKSTAIGSPSKDLVKHKKDKKKFKTGKDAAGNASAAPSNGSPAKTKGKPQKQKNKPEQNGAEAASEESREKKQAKNLEKKLKKKAAKSVTPLFKSEIKNNAGKDGSAKPKKTKQLKSDGDRKAPQKRDPIKEAATVFVGNLPTNTKRVQLLRLFSDYGPVNGVRFRTASGKFLFKHKVRKEAGALIAWVVLKDKETAKRALALNDTLFKNNHLRVTSANHLSNIGIETNRTIFVGNLTYSANEEKLREIFSSCGDIDYIRCLHDDKGCKGVAYVCFKAPEAVGLALELNATMLDERPINVERYSVKKLGAKMKRESTNAATAAKQAKAGGKKPKDNKKHKEAKNRIGEGEKMEVDSASKKSKFRGVKIDALKQKQKKKPTSQMQKLAKKIAPKPKS